MAGTERLRPNTRARAAALREQQRKKEARRRLLTALAAVVAVVGIIGTLVVVRLVSGDDDPPAAAPAVGDAAPFVAQVTSVPAKTLESIGKGSIKALPKPVQGDPLTSNGKPLVVYIGAEYCPFCAMERWPIIMALSRFGTWSDLTATTSAADDVYPNTPTFSFSGAKYTSKYLEFQGVETATNERQGNSYKPLDTLTAEQEQLGKTYNPDGGIPFVDYGNRFVTKGASYDPKVIEGKSMAEIAAAVSKPETDIGKAVGGSANAVTAVICTLTKNQPSSVCALPAVAALRGELGGG